jgi:hypothetical protein
LPAHATTTFEAPPGDRRLAVLAAVAAAAIHAALAVVLATAGATPGDESTAFPLSRSLCEGARCPEKPLYDPRRGPDEVAAPDLGMIEATVVPMLGMAQLKAAELPKLTKYEQPEKIDEAVNLNKDNEQAKPVPNQDATPKKAELDKQRPRNQLAMLLGTAPADDDPRKRPTALERIVGQRDGSTFGSGTEWKQGNVYGGKVFLALREQFTVPPFLNEAELKRSRVRVKVTKMNEAGQILAYDVVETSANPAFNQAAVQAIKRFAPKEGGAAYLPAPDAKTLAFINQNGLLIDLDGALFK